jgi:hypothetical protein
MDSQESPHPDDRADGSVWVVLRWMQLLKGLLPMSLFNLNVELAPLGSLTDIIAMATTSLCQVASYSYIIVASAVTLYSISTIPYVCTAAVML